MLKSLQFWLPAVRWTQAKGGVAFPEDVLRRGDEIIQLISAESMASQVPVWVCGATSATGALARAVVQTIGHWAPEKQSQVLIMATEIAARLALLEQSVWGVPDIDLAAATTAQVIVRACGAGLSDVQTAYWLHTVWNATLTEHLHLTPQQMESRMQAASMLLQGCPTMTDSDYSPLQGWDGLWLDLGSVWCTRALRRLATARSWDEAPVRAMHNILRSYKARNHEELPLEDVVSITISETIVPVGLAWRGEKQAHLEVARCMVQGEPVARVPQVASGTERMVGHFAQRVRPGFEPRARMAGRYFIQQLRWDSVSARIGVGAALAWLLFGRTPWMRGYGWRDLMRAWRLDRSLRWPLLAAVVWACIGRLGPGGGARTWLVSKQCEQSQVWEPAARVELRSRSGVAWAAES